MKLLFDENLSDRLVALLSADFPHSVHAYHVGLKGGRDEAIWQHAAQHNLIIVTKDRDYGNLSTLRGAPPKVILLRLGNGPAAGVAECLVRHKAQIAQLCSDPDATFLELY